MSDLFNLAAKRAFQMSQSPPQKISINIEICQPSEGGLSSIQKGMDIGGEPHKLAYINSDESSLLKAIGGQGEPMKGTNGIPAYAIVRMPEKSPDDTAAMAAYFKRLQEDDDPEGIGAVGGRDRFNRFELALLEKRGYDLKELGLEKPVPSHTEEEKEEEEVEI
jgi:hypothetical protein